MSGIASDDRSPGRTATYDGHPDAPIARAGQVYDRIRTCQTQKTSRQPPKPSGLRHASPPPSGDLGFHERNAPTTKPTPRPWNARTRTLSPVSLRSAQTDKHTLPGEFWSSWPREQTKTKPRPDVSTARRGSTPRTLRSRISAALPSLMDKYRRLLQEDLPATLRRQLVCLASTFGRSRFRQELPYRATTPPR